MPYVVAPAEPHTPAVAVAPLRGVRDGSVVTALSEVEWRARPPSSVSPQGDVVLRDGRRLSFGPAAPWRGLWLAGYLTIAPTTTTLNADIISPDAILGGRVEVQLG